MKGTVAQVLTEFAPLRKLMAEQIAVFYIPNAYTVVSAHCQMLD
jgi:hypothetical protein